LGKSILLVAYRPRDVTAVGNFDEQYVLVHANGAVAGYLRREDVPGYASRIQAMETFKEKEAGGVVFDNLMDEEI
jgi:hypothetical protein